MEVRVAFTLSFVSTCRWPRWSPATHPWTRLRRGASPSPGKSMPS